MAGTDMAAMGDAISESALGDVDGSPTASERFAWLVVLLGAWMVGALFLLVYAYSNGLLNDSVLSAYHAPFYLGVAILGGLCLVLGLRATRRGQNWQAGVPAGYMPLVAGAIALVFWPVAEIGWRVGVGITPGRIEEVFAPSRLVVITGCVLVAGAPLYAALSRPRTLHAGWAPVASAALVFSVLGLIGIQPAQDRWMEAPASPDASRNEIWVMNADGSLQTRLISEPGYAFSNAAWSSDGSRVAYTRNALPDRLGLPTADVAIWVADADGTDPREVIGGTGWYWLPHFSPDGEWILFTLDGQRGPGSGAGILPPDVGFGQPPAAGQPPTVTPNVDIWRVRADGSGGVERVTTDPAEDRAGVLSPDGSRLLFDSTRNEGRTGLYVANADGTNPVQLTSQGDDWGGAWAPDGSAVAFNSSPSGGDYDVYVTAVGDGGVTRQLTDHPLRDAAPSWSPDGTRIAFESTRSEGVGDVWSMASDGSDQVNLTATTGAAEWLTSGGEAWGPDGRIVYVRSQDEPARSSSLVRENLGIASVLLGALMLSLLAVLVVSLGAPFGSMTLIMVAGAAAMASTNGAWQFVGAAFVGGLVVDVLTRLAPGGRRRYVAAAASAAVFVGGAGLMIIATSTLGWSPTLLIGVTITAAALAFGMAVAIGPAGRRLWRDQPID